MRKPVSNKKEHAGRGTGCPFLRISKNERSVSMKTRRMIGLLAVFFVIVLVLTQVVLKIFESREVQQ